MPIFENRTVISIARNVHAFFNLEIGILRGEIPRLQDANQKTQKQLTQMRKQLEQKDREIARLRTDVVHKSESTSVKPENIIWVFGCGRTGSSWLTAIMKDIRGHARWDEPYVGDIFGYAYYMRNSEWMRGRKAFVMGDSFQKTWLKSIRQFVLDGANARFPEIAGEGCLVIKEPNGSIGAPLLVKALPESRVIFLVRDPRDTVASMLASQKKGSWGAGQRAYSEGEFSLADENPDEFVRQRAQLYMASITKAREAYEVHEGHKTLVRYEDLRYETFEELKKLYSKLNVPVNEKWLERLVEKHTWENVPEEQKGSDKPRRKAKPGGWKEDLTPQQAKIVEEIAAPVLEEFYSS